MPGCGGCVVDGVVDAVGVDGGVTTGGFGGTEPFANNHPRLTFMVDPYGCWHAQGAPDVDVLLPEIVCPAAGPCTLGNCHSHAVALIVVGVRTEPLMVCCA